MREEDIKTLADLLYYSTEKNKDKIYMKEKEGDGVRTLSYGDFLDNTRRISAFIQDKAKGKKIHVGMIGTSSIPYLTAMFGTFISGSAAVPIDPQLTPEEIADNLIRADVTILFYDIRFSPMIPILKNICSGIKTYVCLQENPEAGDILTVGKLIKECAPAEAVDISPDELACILYTSGTTGKSKGVMLSHGNLIDNAYCCDDECDSAEGEQDILLTVLPIHHAYCITCDILLSMRYGAILCINDSIMRIAQNIKLFAPTKILLVPMIADTIYRKIAAMHKAKPEVPIQAIGRSVFGESLGVIFCGGAFLPPELVIAYKDLGIPLLQGYGMTECSPRISSSSLKDPTTGKDVGRVVKRCEVRIVDGEIQAKSPSVMMGYYKNEEATKEMFTEDGWLKTGDLGYIEDERIYITGRKKNLIILSNGENISPEELENRFAGEEWLAEVLVYSEDEQITAEVYPRPEFATFAEKLFREKVDDINRSVAMSKRIMRLRLRENEFDKTTSKKVKRNQPGEKGRLL